MKIYAGRLPVELTESELEEMFKKFGTVNSVKLDKDKYTKKSLGYGHIEIPDDKQANKAIKSLNGKSVKGSKIVVAQAITPEEDGKGKGKSNYLYGGGKRNTGMHDSTHRFGGSARKTGK